MFCLSCGHNPEADKVIERDGFRIDPRGLCYYNDRRVEGLTAVDVCVLHSIAAANGRPVASGTLTARCCPSSEAAKRSAVAITQIRKFLRMQSVPCPIQTVQSAHRDMGGYFWHVVAE